MDCKNEDLPVVTYSAPPSADVFENRDLFECMQRGAKLFASSDLVPAQFKGNVANCFIAMHLARNLEVDPFMLMQNCYVVHGKPGLEGKLCIALVNKRGPYVSGLTFRFAGEGDQRSCTAQGVRAGGEIDTCSVSVSQAKELGWYQKNPLWKSMTDQMLIYRSATWLARRHCPEVLMGLQSAEELKDVHGVTVLPPEKDKRSALNDVLDSTVEDAVAGFDDEGQQEIL